MHGRVGRAQRQVVAVERDVDVAERDLVVQQVAHELVQALGEMGAAAVDADERDGPAGVLLDDLVRDAYERAADVVLVEDDDLLVGQAVPSWPLGTGLKGRRQGSSGGRRLAAVMRAQRRDAHRDRARRDDPAPRWPSPGTRAPSSAPITTEDSRTGATSETGARVSANSTST